MNISAISAGKAHACALTTSGGLKCWGWNNYGQLGDGTHTSRSLPMYVSGMESGIVDVSTGYGHTCALTASGGVKCWGSNIRGVLGDGTTTPRSLPVDVAGLSSDVVEISVGNSFSCAVTVDGGVKCWGDNTNGQLGDGTTTNRYTPVSVIGLTEPVESVAAGFADSACALTVSGGVMCWGWNNNGQLGNGTTTNSSSPVNVIGLSSGVLSLDLGYYHACAVTSSNGVVCWGDNSYAQLGNGTLTDRSIPGDVSGLPNGVVSVDMGSIHSCALTSAGGLKCWGNNGDGRLGDGTVIQRSTPVDVIGLGSGIAAVSPGFEFTCAVTAVGGAKCWGNNSFGQLGASMGVNSSVPVDVLVKILESSPSPTNTKTPTKSATLTTTPTNTRTSTPTVTPSLTPP